MPRGIPPLDGVDCTHPQTQNRKLRSRDRRLNDWLIWCPRCHLACSDDGQVWFHDDSLPWPGQLVAYTGQRRQPPM